MVIVSGFFRPIFVLILIGGRGQAAWRDAPAAARAPFHPDSRTMNSIGTTTDAGRRFGVVDRLRRQGNGRLGNFPNGEGQRGQGRIENGGSVCRPSR